MPAVDVGRLLKGRYRLGGPPGADQGAAQALQCRHHPDRVAPVRPGGWLVVEDFDLGANRLTATARQALGKAGVDTAYGRRLPAEFHAAGLVDVHVEVNTFLCPISEIGELMRPVYSRVRHAIGDLGLVSDAEIGQVLAETEDPDADRWTYTPMLVSVCGRRPG